MKKHWLLRLLVITWWVWFVSVMFGPYVLQSPEITAGLLTVLVVLAAIVVPFMGGWVFDYLNSGPSKSFDTKDYIMLWILGAITIAFTGVVFTAGYFAISEVYHYILNLLGG